MRGYPSKYWGLAVAANWHLKENNDKGIVWVQKTILQIWEFSHSTCPWHLHWGGVEHS
jgi:hypothetical protein